MTATYRSLQLSEARHRFDLLRVTSYDVTLDLAAVGDHVPQPHGDPVRVGSGSTFVDVKPVTLHAATLDGAPLDVAALDRGRLPLELAAGSHELVVEATMPFRNDGEGHAPLGRHGRRPRLRLRHVLPRRGAHDLRLLRPAGPQGAVHAPPDHADGLARAGQRGRHRGRARPLGARDDPAAGDVLRQPRRRALPRARGASTTASRSACRPGCRWPGTSTSRPTSCSP